MGKFPFFKIYSSVSVSQAMSFILYKSFTDLNAIKYVKSVLCKKVYCSYDRLLKPVLLVPIHEVLLRSSIIHHLSVKS